MVNQLFKRFLPIVLCSPAVVFAQHEFSNFTAAGRAGVATTMLSDYQCLGINPANLAFAPRFEGKKVTIGFFEVAGQMSSNSLSKANMQKSFLDYSDGNFTFKDKNEAISQIANDGLSVNLDMALFGAAFQLPDQNMGFGLTVRDRLQWFSRLNELTTDILFKGAFSDYFDKIQVKMGDGTTQTIDLPDPNSPNYEAEVQALYEQYKDKDVTGIVNPGNEKMLSDIFSGSKVTLSWTREINAGFGMKVVDVRSFKLMAGLGLKYILGYANLDVSAEDGEFIRAIGTAPGFVDIDWGTDLDNHPNAAANGLFSPVGRGFGIDLGLNATINDNTKFGLALANFGSMAWQKNLYTFNDKTLDSISSGGFNSYNMFNEAEKITSEEGPFPWQYKESANTPLPSMLRLGASQIFKHEENEWLEVGADVTFPLNDVAGNFDKPLFALGGDFRPIKNISLSSGLSWGGNREKIGIPVGVIFNVGNGGWEFGFASRDALSYFLDNGTSLSFATGILRFRM